MKYFGTDGVRGIANKELSPELAFKLGRCGGFVLTKHASDAKPPKVLVARDTRVSGQMLEQALIAGLLSVGIEVFSLGVITTPGVAYLVRVQDADAGIMISASHNPVEDNGIKFFGGDGYKLSDEKEEEIEELLESGVDNLPRPSANGLGTLSDYHEGVLKYTQFLEQTIPDNLEDLHIAVDGANGATSGLVSRLFADLGVEFETMATEPDGLNINKAVGSTHPEALSKFVVEKEAQLGVAFDGDGDRCIAVDELGNIVDGDKIMYICGKYLSERGRLKKDTIVTTVMSNIGLYKAMENHELHSVKTQVGDRYVVEEMRKDGYNLGGEQSGHVVFLDFNTTGDGMLTALQLLNVVQKTGKKLSELAGEVTTYPQELINVKVTDKKAALENEAIKEIIKQVEIKMGSEGRVLVRPSGTENLLRVMAEAKTKEEVHEYVMQIVDVVKKEMGV
ncbi:MAG: phosphoglucosamine mutase [Liquorilactobacillus hordei]|uniref:Phosphoglucosamine mutase n=2 Tax=Liquorilactobacillus hordei TaxID=468911 RepID=A0A0R1M7D9_9LACO|nr:phosphoglucosamine mutase [Liquorilactobacillus hordei]AUJ30242.1 phosphoglucosamine mutase [Liquorilactobacillus hordei]KRL04080.1 phosphoglucosamine mutase [Liquorilactobacillus hordei DSM 19519]MBZ2406721.1 phosphoglucosamine mutase [Liquorilactobacillus hordei]QYH52854.1 phosphoglucosamine mutase [Liquorilactobacillus hordei DSM 19519]